MTKAQKIEKYIKECFEEFSLNLKEYFYYDFEEDNWEEISWTNEDGTINRQIVSYASEILGISVDDILSTSENAIMKWLRKFPYLGFINPFRFAYERTYYGKGYDEMHLIETIFDTKMDTPYPTRFNYDDVVHRLITQLKDIDKLLPGTFHYNANITKLQISTENFCKFEEIKEMTESFISMIDRVIDLFIKAVNNDLENDEIHEYNLLVSVFGLRDKYYTKGYLYYSQLVKVKDLYTSASKEDISNYIIFKRSMEFKPWRCADFINDEELVKKYLVVVPQAKKIMSQFALSVSQFKCSFVWSDAKPAMLSLEEEQELEAIDKMLGEKPTPLEQRAKERTFVNVDKTADELNGDDRAAEKLLGYCRPAKLDGIKVKMPESSSERLLNHTQFLMGKVLSNNFIERTIDLAYDLAGGGDND